MLIVKILVYFILISVAFAGGYIWGVRKHTLKIQTYYETHVSEERKNIERLQLAYSWLNMYIEGKSIADFFNVNNITSVAIYGYGINGKVLEKILCDAGVKIECIIDKNPNNVISNIPVYSLDTNLPSIELLVITSVSTQKSEIEMKINSECKVVYLREIMALIL